MPIKSKSQDEGPVNQSRSERERDGVGGDQQLYLREELIDVCMYVYKKRDIQKYPCFDMPLSSPGNLLLTFFPESA